MNCTFTLYILFALLTLFWFIRQTKAVSFWLYLWQLKEYHIGRFLDHFRTEKGKKLIFNKLFALKLALIFIFFSLCHFLRHPPAGGLFFYFPFILLFLYLIESAKGFLDFSQKKLKKPVFTKKIIFLFLLTFIFEILFLLFLSQTFLFQSDSALFAFWLLIFDVLTPIIVSIIVLLAQPIAVLARSRIIKKARKKRESFKNLLVIGITGSYGKTSTKEFLAAILAEKFNVLKTKEHQNSEIGISQCILNDLKSEHEIFICEMGAYNLRGIKLLCDIAKPKIGILTGINEQHMATFGSQENIVKGKFELIESLPEDGIAFFNAKNKYCLELYQKAKIKKILYGQDVQLAGLENIEGAKVVARELGMSSEEIIRVSQKIENKIPGLQFKKGINGLNIIDSTYSANPDGVISHLEYLKTFPGKKVIIMPCLIELGKASREVHKRIGQKIAEVCDLAIITTKDRFREIKEEAGEKAVFMENPKNVFEKVKEFCQEKDTVLLESRLPGQLIKQLVI